MNTNEKDEGIARNAQRSLALAGLLIATLCFAGPSRAQSRAASASSPAAKSGGPAVSQGQASPAATQAPGSAAAAKPAAPAEKNSTPGANGSHEGITVHGHWTIDVKNPDGTVATHREFENALQPGAYGALGALIAGNSSSAGLVIGLDMKAVVIDQGGYGAGSLARLDDYRTAGGPCYTGDTQQGFGCLITTTVLGPVSQVTCSGGSATCTTTLMQNAPTLTAINAYNGSVVQLSGTAPAGFPSTISDVETFLFTCDNSVSPQACSTLSGYPTVPLTSWVMFTERNLDGNTAAGAAAGDPMPVPVSARQTIAVTVTISFQ